MNEFMIQFYDEETNLTVQYVYEMSPKGYFYETCNTSDGITHYKHKRISEQAITNALETYLNA